MPFPKGGRFLKDFFEHRGLRIFFITAAAAASLCLFSAFSPASSALYDAVGVIVTPFRSAASTVQTRIAEQYRHYTGYSALLRENEALQQEVAALRQNARQAQRDREENALLRKLLGLREQRRDFVFASAGILAHSDDNWSSTLTLDCGTDCGISVNDCVVTAEGYFVGVVSEVGASQATVLAVIDTDTSLGARILRTSEAAMVEGDFALMCEGRLKLSYLRGDTSLLPGDTIVTSGLGGYYPSGLVIGTVSSVETDDDGFTRYAVIAPAADFDARSEVFVIKDFDVVD